MAGTFWLEPILTGLLPESGDLKRRAGNQVHLARVRAEE